jgi:hypothetical protein
LSTTAEAVAPPSSPPPRKGPLALRRIAPLLPIALFAVSVPGALQAPVDLYDGGLMMTLARFTGPSLLPYRDLWTLYGPGPPVWTSLVSDVAGPGVTQLRAAHLAVMVLLLVGTYLLLRRLVPWWAAALLAAVVATVGSPQGQHHFTMTLAFIFWGLWFIDRVADDRARSSRRAAIGGLLIGLSFLGRYEYAVVAIPTILGVAWALRTASGVSEARAALIWGLAPPTLFGLYLLLVVGLDRAVLNLFTYPFLRYPSEDCRGLPTMWGDAAHALFAPLRGRIWQGGELTLGAGTFVAPLIGVAGAGFGIVSWLRSRALRPVVGIVLGLLTLFLWIEMRPRISAEPSPTWPTMVATIAFLLGSAWGRRPRAAGVLAAVIAGVLLSPVPFSWIPERLPAWGTWPRWDARFGFSRMDRYELYDPDTWSGIRAAVHRITPPGRPIFVALDVNTGHFANAPLLYWYVDRPPGSRFIEFNPCLTDTESVQRLMIHELGETDTVITTSLFPNVPPPFGPVATSLDRYLDSRFTPVHTAGVVGTQTATRLEIAVLVRNGTLP